MVFTQRPSAHLRPLVTTVGLGTILCKSNIARFVQGGVVKTFRCAATYQTMEIIFELLAQLVLEIFVQGVFELGGHGIVSIFRKEGSAVNPWLAICGYIAMGAVAGVISVWIIPCLLYTSPSPRDRQKSRMPSSA